MKTPIFTGCATAIATPFSEKGVNFEEFGRLIENQIQKGIDAIVVCGTTGEASTMTETEKKQTIKYAVEVTKNECQLLQEQEVTIQQLVFRCLSMQRR